MIQKTGIFPVFLCDRPLNRREPAKQLWFGHHPMPCNTHHQIIQPHVLITEPALMIGAGRFKVYSTQTVQAITGYSDISHIASGIDV
ncbi:hypothetical protein CI610_02321 [invertebrate metagenome]|uniref:Uncharacterized protein n=1 Tax=invertebrate metagenome TaxID=1711999 RepID=A0A2H9T676_9ZZZZ